MKAFGARTCLAAIAILMTSTVFSQKLKNKEIKKALDGGVSEISIVTEDKFFPGYNQEMDLRIVLANGTAVLASDYHFLWDDVVCTVTNSGWKIKGELLSNGKGLLVPYILPKYAPGSEGITISMELKGKKAEKSLSASYCIKNFMITEQGIHGSDGSSGSSKYNYGMDGGDGKEGSNGRNGADISVEVNEEMVGDKNYAVIVLNNQKYFFDPSCSSVQVISQGGNGGDGGRGGNGGDSDKNTKGEFKGSGGSGGRGGSGGNGGNGGTITVSGNAAQKYKSIITFVSAGGKGGEGASGGRGGSGKSSGRSGSYGRDGSDGNNGQVIFQ